MTGYLRVIKTTAVQAVLCGPCNQGIGCLRDDPDNLKRAIECLDTWRARF